MKLVIGFITYNESSAKYLADFLDSLKEALFFLSEEDFQVLVFDNSDHNNLLNKEKINSFNELNPGFLRYISTDNNLGFSRAYNILIREALNLHAEYFLIINPDIVLERDCIKNLFEALKSQPDLAAVSPKLRRWDFATNTKTKIIDSCGLKVFSGLRFRDLGQGIRDEKQFDKNDILAPSGAAGLFRLKCLEDIKDENGYFDERFFMYKEDCDLAYRLFIKGYRSTLVPNAILYHDRTAAAKANVFSRLFSRRKKSRQIRTWSFIGQHLLFIKYWQKQTIFSKFFIICQLLAIFFIALFFEQFLLKEYRKIKVLTNIK
jgi:GT2 family glycosyltransferase